MRSSALRRMLRRALLVWRFVLFRVTHRRVELEGFLYLGRGVRVDVSRTGHVILGNAVRIGDHSHINCKGELVRVGARTVFGHHTEIDSVQRVTIGSDCLASSFLHVVDYDHGFVGPELIAHQPLDSSPIDVGDDVWFGRAVTVTRGTVIGTHSVVGAHAVVRGAFSGGIVLAGVPARRVQTIGLKSSDYRVAGADS